MKDVLKCWQINLQHAKAASANLIADLNALNEPCLVFVQEPHLWRGQVKNLGAKNFDLITAGEKPRSALLCPRVLGCTLVEEVSDNDFVCCILNTKIEEKPNILIVSGYLDQNLTMEATVKKLQEIKDFANKTNLPVILAVDANTHSNAWGGVCENESGCKGCKRGPDLEEFLLVNDLSLCNVGKIPTFVTSRTKGTVIDLTICSNEIDDLITDWLVNEEDSFSDHKRIEFNLKLRYNPKIKIQNFDKTNWILFNRIIDGVELAERPTWNPDELDKEVDILNKRFKSALNKACPPKEVNLFKKSQPPWWNEELAAARRVVRTKYRKARRVNLEVDWKSYRDERSNYNKLLNRSKTASWRDFASEIASTKNMARLVRNLGKNKLPPAGLFKGSDGQTCTNLEDSIQVVFDGLFPGNIQESNNSREITCTSLQVETGANFITEEKVARAISTFGSNKSPGPDGIKPIVLKNLSKKGIKILTKLFKISVMLNYVPRSWREARIALLPKPNKERYDVPKSFRPIALTSFIFKTLERVVLWELEDTVLNKRPISKHQHAYLKGKSCDTALSVVVDKIEQGALRGQYSLGVFLDIQGAFDYVNPDRAIDAMKRKGANPNIVKWYAYYLGNRMATITLNETSGTRGLPRGVPQGGIISPIAWDLVIDSLLVILNKEKNVTAVGYADDVAIVVNGIDPAVLVDIAQKAINKACTWGRKNDLKFNASKTEAIFFTQKKTTTNKLLRVNGEEVQYAKGCKYLGVYLDSKLSWKPHFQNQIKRCKTLLYSLKATVGRKWGVNPKLVRWVFTGMVRPILAYAVHVWWNFCPSKTMIDDLTKLSRLVCLAISGVHRSTPTRGMEVMYHLMPLEIYLNQQAMLTYHRIRKPTKPPWINPGGRPGHLARLGKRAESIDVPQIVEKTIFTRIWKRHYFVNLDFDSTRNDSKENRYTWYVYTDGSKVHGKSGWGFVIKRGGQVLKSDFGYMGAHASVFQAEIEAIKQASTFLKPLKGGSKIIFRIDNQAAVWAVANPEITKIQTLECVSALQEIGTNNHVSLRWIKAHAGHDGNEAADVAAKNGAQLRILGPEPFFEVPQAAVKLSIKTFYSNSWRKQWIKSAEYVHTKLFYPTPSHKMTKILGKISRENLSLMAQVITGHCNLLYHSRHYNPDPDEADTLCRLCQEDEEKPWHLLTDCPVLMQRRLEVFGQPLVLTKHVSWSPTQVLTFFNEQSIRHLFDHVP